MAIGFDEDSAILALNDKDETFDEWKLKNAPEDTGEDYDLAGAFNANLHPAENGYFPDTFKKPNHPTFSNQSIYSTGDQSGGEWGKDEQGNDTFKPSSWMGSDPARQEALRSYFKEKEPNATLIDPDPYVEPFDPSTAIPREEHIKNLVNDPTFDPARHKDFGVSKEDAFEVRQKKKDRTIIEKTKAFASGISGATFAEAAKGVAKFIGGLAVMTGEGVTQTVGPAVSAILKGLGYNALAKNVDNELRAEQREIALGASRGEESVKSLGRTAKELSGDISHWMSGGLRDDAKERADFDEDIAATDREKQLQEGKFIEGSVVSKIAKAGSNIFGEGKDIESTIGAKRLEEEGARKENELVVEMLSAGMDPVNIAMMVSGVATGGATSIAGKAATALAKAGVSGRVAASVIRAGMSTASGVAYIPKLIANTATSTLGAAASFPFKVIRAIPSRLGRIARVGDTGITAGMAIEAALHPAIALKAAGIAATAKFLGILGEGLSAAGRTGATALDQKILTGSTLGQKNLLLKGSRALGEGVNKFIKSSIDFDPVNLISSGGDPNKFADETIAAGMFGGIFAAKAHFRRSVQKGLNVRAHEALMVVDGERNYTDINPDIFAFHQGNLMRFDEGTQREIKKARHFANGMGTDIIVLSPEQADYINANRAKFNFDIPSEFKRSSGVHISSDGRILINTGTLGILDGKAGFFGGGMQNQAHLHEIGHAVLDTIGKSIETTHGQQVVKILDSALTKEEFEAAGLAYVRSLYKEVGPAQEAALRQLKDNPLIHKDEILSEISRSLLRGQDLASYGFSQESNRIITSKFGKTMHDIMRALGMGLTQMDFGAYDTKVDISGKMGPQYGQVWNQELAKAYNTLLHEYGQRATRKMRGTLTDADREFYQKLKEKPPVPPKDVAEEATPEATPEKIGHLTPKEILDAHKSDSSDPIGAVIDAHKAKSEADNKGGLTVEIHNEGDSAKEFRTVDGVLIKGDSFSEYILDQVLVGTERRPLTQEERDIITGLNTGGVNGFVYGHAGTVENPVIDAARRREQILNPAKARIDDSTRQQKEQKRALFVNAVFNEKTREITLQMLSVDKLNNNYKNLVESINIANERGANIVNPYASEAEVVADLKSYAENYKNNYLGDGAGVAKDANGVPLVPSGTPIPIPNERFDFINLLLANESAKSETPLGLARRRIAEANGIDLGADKESNPLRGQLNAALGPKWSSRTLESPHEILRPELISEINGDITSVGGLRNVGPEFNEAFDKGIPDENMVAGNYMPKEEGEAEFYFTSSTTKEGVMDALIKAGGTNKIPDINSVIVVNAFHGMDVKMKVETITGYYQEQGWTAPSKENSVKVTFKYKTQAELEKIRDIFCALGKSWNQDEVYELTSASSKNLDIGETNEHGSNVVKAIEFPNSGLTEKDVSEIAGKCGINGFTIYNKKVLIFDYANEDQQFDIKSDEFKRLAEEKAGMGIEGDIAWVALRKFGTVGSVADRRTAYDDRNILNFKDRQRLTRSREEIIKTIQVHTFDLEANAAKADTSKLISDLADVIVGDKYMPEDGSNLADEDFTLGGKGVSYMPIDKKTGKWIPSKGSLMEYEGEYQKIVETLLKRFGAAGDPQSLRKLLKEYPEYLDGPLRHIMDTSVRLKEGKIEHKELAKAYIMTIVSQGAGAISLDALQDSLIRYNEKMDRENGQKINFKINPSEMFLHQRADGKMDARPEEIAAYWITTDEGKNALNKLDYYSKGLTSKGLAPVEGSTEPELMPAKYNPEDFAIMKLLREFYGDDRVASSGMMLGNIEKGEKSIRQSRPVWETVKGSKATKKDKYGDKIQAKDKLGNPEVAWSEKKIGEISLSNLNEALEKINSNKGNKPQEMIDILLKFKGIDSAKAPFLGHFIGFGQRITLDAVEKNYEIGQTADSRDFGKIARERIARRKGRTREQISAEKIEADMLEAELKDAEEDIKLSLRKELEVLSKNKKIQGLARKFIENKINIIRAERLAKNPDDPIGKIKPEAFFHIMHHWIWDAAKGLETTHEGLYEAMKPKYMPSEGIPEHYKSVDDFREHWNSLGVHNMTSIRAEGSKYEHIRPLEIEVEKDNRNNGLGSAFMRDLTAFADLNGMQININPSDELGATSIGRLGRFYKRFGFVENKSGKNKDYTISERFYRPASKYIPSDKQKFGVASYMPSEEVAGKPYNRKHDITIRAMLRNAQNQKRDLTTEEKSKINDLVGKNLPVDQVPTKDVLASMASQEKVNSAIDSKQKLSNQFDHSGNSIASPWDKVDFDQKATGRQDVPSMTRHNTGVVTIAQKGPDGKLSSIYVPFALFEGNPRLAAPQTEKIKGIGAGDAKSPDLGVISGKLSRTQEIPDDIESWTQVGFNPDRHSYFYLKSDQTKGVTGGEKIVQIGNTVFVKNPVFATPEEQASYKYMPFAGEGATGFAEAEKRGDVFVNPFDFMKRFEISDDKMKSKDAWQKLTNSVLSKKITIGDLYDHEELFKNYPWLRDVPVIKDPNLKSRGSARADNRIRIGDQFLKDIFIAKDKNPSADISIAEHYLKKTMIHEIQHLIQFREKFPRGAGASKEFLLQRLDDIEKSKIRQIDRAEQKFNSIPHNDLNKLKAKKIDADLDILHEDLLEWQKYYFDKYFYKNGKFTNLLSHQQLFDLYFSAVGEMEARMASDRSEFSDDYRKQNPAIYKKQAHPFLNFHRDFPYPQWDAIYDAKMAEVNAQRLKVDRYMPLDEMADEKGIPSMIPSEAIGKPFTFIMADLMEAHTPAERAKLRLSGRIPSSGGMGYAINNYGSEVCWASMGSAVKSIIKQLKDRGSFTEEGSDDLFAYVMPYTMKTGALISNNEYAMQRINELKNWKKLNPVEAASLEAEIRQIANKKNIAIGKDFDIDNFDFSTSKEGKSTFKSRAALMEKLASAEMAEKYGLPSGLRTAFEAIDPFFHGIAEETNKKGGLHNALLLKVNVTQTEKAIAAQDYKNAKIENSKNNDKKTQDKLKKAIAKLEDLKISIKDVESGTQKGASASEYGVEQHPSYNSVILGTTVALLRNPVHNKLVQPDHINSLMEWNKKFNERSLSRYDKKMLEIDEEYPNWREEHQKEIEASDSKKAPKTIWQKKSLEEIKEYKSRKESKTLNYEMVDGKKVYEKKPEKPLGVKWKSTPFNLAGLLTNPVLPKGQQNQIMTKEILDAINATQTPASIYEHKVKSEDYRIRQEKLHGKDQAFPSPPLKRTELPSGVKAEAMKRIKAREQLKKKTKKTKVKKTTVAAP